MILLIDNEVAPEITGAGSATTYTPGRVHGRGYVYSMRDGKIICATAIDARNTAPEASPYLDALSADARGLLHREMEVQMRQLLVSGMRAL